jgi:hypothetical protein
LRADHTWDTIDGAAVQIDVHPDGYPYVVNAEGKLFRRNRLTNAWEYLNTYASAIAVAADGTLWGLENNVVPGGARVVRYVGENTQETLTTTGGAVRIAAVNEISACVVNSLSEIFITQLSA